MTRFALRLREERSLAEIDALVERLRTRVAERRGWSCDERWLKRQMCVFLQSNRMCGIYEFRPLNCRGWTSKSRDDCASESTVTPHALVHLASQAVGNGLTWATAAMELEAHSYEFEAAILRALEIPDAAERWARGEQIFTGCDQISMPDEMAHSLTEMLLQG
jgi:Fe-S-cluster containining protein